MACCLTATNHHLNHCWLTISVVLWLSPEGNFTGNIKDIYHENWWFKIITTSPRDRWVDNNKTWGSWTGISSDIILHIPSIYTQTKMSSVNCPHFANQVISLYPYVFTNTIIQISRYQESTALIEWTHTCRMLNMQNIWIIITRK